MTSKTKSTLRSKHGPLARLLAFVLLALVTYAATAESVHKHGNAVVDRSAQTRAAFSTANGDGSSLNDSRTLGNCAVCQLHQNLSSTLLSVQPGIIAPQTQATQRPAIEPSYLSQSDTPHSGRGPPTTSLS